MIDSDAEKETGKTDINTTMCSIMLKCRINDYKFIT
jgi:hypothetical protein